MNVIESACPGGRRALGLSGPEDNDALWASPSSSFPSLPPAPSTSFSAFISFFIFLSLDLLLLLSYLFLSIAVFVVAFSSFPSFS